LNIEPWQSWERKISGLRLITTLYCINPAMVIARGTLATNGSWALGAWSYLSWELEKDRIECELQKQNPLPFCMNLLCNLGRGRRREREDTPKRGEEIRGEASKEEAPMRGVPVILCMLPLQAPTSRRQRAAVTTLGNCSAAGLSSIHFRVLTIPAAHQINNINDSTCSLSRNNSRPHAYCCCHNLPASHLLQLDISIRFN
jgi:hypothetical protein